MSRHRFPASVARKMYWSDGVKEHASCPDCGSALQSERHTYMVVTRRRGDMDFHMVGNNAGHFCGSCPVVVLDRNEFERFVALAVRRTDGVDYVAMGIVDLDAVPEDKRSLPFDDDTNPVPLVQFTSVGGEEPSARSAGKRPSNRERENRRKKRQ